MFGENLKELRVAHGLTQYELGQKIGVSQGAIYFWEKGINEPTAGYIVKLADFFGLSGVTSPTYAYLNVYGDFIYHYDCYRLDCGEDAVALGLTDYMGGDNISLIEWAENIADVLPENVKTVRILKTEDTDLRIIEL